ncbi:MAG: hypothetical protein PUC44_07145 [Eubacteriales bacterium]|nr:hypothetical protein [Eubacteriales bacterium]
MRKKNSSKDFIYNYSDILIAVLILAAAALIIAWRVQVIMAYPSTLTKSDKAKVTEEVKKAQTAKSEKKKEQAEASGKTSNSDSSSDSSSSSKSSDSSSKSSSSSSKSSKSSSSSLFKKEKLTKSVTVNIPSGSLDNAVQSLVDAGLFDDANEYNTLCAAAGVDPSSIKTGEFKLEKGMSKTDIAIRVTTYN